jgi:hypothetical protein
MAPPSLPINSLATASPKPVEGIGRDEQLIGRGAEDDGKAFPFRQALIIRTRPLHQQR